MARALVGILLISSVAHAGDARRIAAALYQIRRSVDPCGESTEVARVLDRFERCAGYEIRTSTTVDRNLFYRRLITWNPDLRSELEPACAGEPARPLLRDPTASLLHEFVHAAQACEGRSPDELEAVRIENIYRRAAHLCQRTGYGDTPLPTTACEPTRRRGTTPGLLAER